MHFGWLPLGLSSKVPLKNTHHIIYVDGFNIYIYYMYILYIYIYGFALYTYPIHGTLLCFEEIAITFPILILHPNPHGLGVNIKDTQKSDRPWASPSNCHFTYQL